MSVAYSNRSTTDNAIIGVIRVADMGLILPNAPDVASLLKQYPRSVNRLLPAAPNSKSSGVMTISDPTLNEMYSRLPSANSMQYLLNIKAPTSGDHPTQMMYMLYLCAGNGL